MFSLACRHVYNDFKVHISSRHAIDAASSTCNSNKTCDPRPSSRIPHRSDRLLTFLRFQSRPGEGRPLHSRSPRKLHLDPDEIRSSRYYRLRKVASDPNLQQSTSIALPGWCIGVQIEMKMTLFLGHGTQAKWQTPSSYRPITLLPSCIGSNPGSSACQTA